MLRKAMIAALCFALLGGQAFAANAYISEFSALTQTSSGVATAQAATLPSNADQKVDFSGGVASSSAFGTNTKYIRVHCDAACSIRVGGTAAITNLRIPTDGIEYFGVLPGQTLSVIANP